jgi:hypothetical protein
VAKSYAKVVIIVRRSAPAQYPVVDRGYANFVELRFHAVGYPGGEVLPASTYKQLAFGSPQEGARLLEETRLPCCSRTDDRSAAQFVRSFVTKASPPSKEVSKVRG